MGGEENAMGFQNGNESILSTNVSEMAMSSVTMAKPSSDNNPFLVCSSNWDPLSMVVSHNDFVNSNSNSSPYPNLVLENHHQGMSSGTSSQFVHYMSESNLGGMISSSKVHHSFGSGSFSEMVVGSFGDVNNTRFRAHSMNGEKSQVDDSVLEEGGSGPSGNSRKRGLDHCSTFSPNKNGEGDALKDSPGKSSDGQREHEKKPKVEQNASVDLRGKQPAKQAKDSSQSGEAPKENFIHVRARRGQATNSHSLAERVRREKISERMRLLQELVPGCSKITGKAVMLDEIINYVQSLQQQVEFLSMKLATVNPELNFDVERILSKDILQTRIGHEIGGYGISSSHSHPLFHSGNFQGTLAGMPSTSTQFPPLPQAVLDHEFQSFYGMGYDSSTALDTLGPNGRLKTEL